MHQRVRVHGAHQRELAGVGGQLRHQAGGEHHAIDVGGVEGGGRYPVDHLEIERIGVAGRAREQNEDHVLGRVLRGRAGGGNIRGARVALGEVAAGDAGADDGEEVPARPVGAIEEGPIVPAVLAEPLIDFFLFVAHGVPLT